jgi:cell wall-associated NlpC family hydrolase
MLSKGLGCVMSIARALTLAGLVLVSCGSPAASSPRADQAGAASGACAAHRPAANPLPGIKPEETTLDYWLARYTPAELDAVLLDDAQIAAYNQRIGRRQGRENYSQRDLRVPADSLALQDELRERFAMLRPDVLADALVARTGTPLPEPTKQLFQQPVKLTAPKQRVLLERTLLRCGPYADGLYKPELQLAYDRNACGPLYAQEPVDVLGSAGDMLLVRSRYSLGFVPARTALSEPIPAAYQSAFLRPTRVVAAANTQLVAADGSEPVRFSERTSLPVLDNGELVVASGSGWKKLQASAALAPNTRPLTRRALLQEAFATLNKPYGLGGTEGGLDCSGLVLDLFESFDLALTRYSGWQAEGGNYHVDLRQVAPDEKLRRLDAAAKSGVVLLYLPGHIMLYLGRSQSGTPLALHALGEYVEPCGTGETVVDVRRVIVSGLELGKNSSRGSLLERVTRLVVFGPQPTAAIEALSEPKPATPPTPLAREERCEDSAAHRIFVSPAAPKAGDVLRAIAASQTDPGDASLRIFDAEGRTVPIDEFALGGPPFGHVARATKLRAGMYTAVLGTGDKHTACRKIRVQANGVARPAHNDAKEGDPYWEPRATWQRDTEALYALFVEQLFAGAPDDEQTWTNLHSLLRDPARNLLWNHLDRGEDEKLEIEPDCADLPYSLRAYFAWKQRLPYAYRQCSRGRTDKPPSCGDLLTNLAPRKISDDVPAFSEFVNRGVRWGVHSGTGRTHPDDSNSDLYPVAFERAALMPGTVYADPYGHVMMISKWFAQGSIAGSPYGVLMAAEAQPDGTIGRRRFWQGSFLFDPNTNSYGAGFKRFRPLEYERDTQSLRTLDNSALTHQREFPRWSRQQYEGGREEFYEQMEQLINPRPLPPSAHLQSLIAALDEAARRRVLSVDNGVQYTKTHPQAVIAMPQGYEIFETEGAWEDFATPSRDMRLLIAIDTVRALPGRVERSPERFELPANTAPSAAADELRTALERELRARSFVYTRSDGSAQSLTLADVMARADAFEIAYNPNDCVEARWGAPANTPEYSTCKRRAPEAQRRHMETYRSWFRTRTRPPRGS